MKRESRQITRDEYLAEMAKVHGDNPRLWKCQCPACGIIYSLEQCGDTADDAQRGMFGCIGRINGKGGDAFGDAPPSQFGCNLSANGLFRSPWLLWKEQIGVGELVGIMPIAPATEAVAA